MATIVVGGSGRGVGKTALVCGLIAALPEFRWKAVKITAHDHGQSEPIWEESKPGQGSDTARYLASGAAQSLLLTTATLDLQFLLSKLWTMVDRHANVIFESNRILEHLKPDLCLMIRSGDGKSPSKPSFRLAATCADAWVTRGESDQSPDEVGSLTPAFYLADFEKIASPMRNWVVARLASSSRS